jgi:hypothetical protein
MPTTLLYLLAWMSVCWGQEPPARPVDFDTEIVPVLTVAGCNSGACHGSAAGRGGLKLSLLGSDPAVDHDALARADEGRRVDVVRPPESLVLRKVSGALDHGGDVRLREGSPGYLRLESWIRAGAGRTGARRLVSLDVRPSTIEVEQPGGSFELRATAAFSDGATDDVTPWVALAPDDADAVDIEALGPSLRVLVRRRGLHVITARFLNRTVPVTVLVPVGDTAVSIPESARANAVDDFVNSLLARLRIRPAPAADDPTFLRRVWLALTGSLPSPDEARNFLEDPRPDRRNRLIEKLMASSAFDDFWTYKTLRAWRARSVGSESPADAAFQSWVRAQVSADAPLDKVTRDLLLGRGDSEEVGPAAFHRMFPGPREEAEAVSEVFLGARLRCASCHDHPLDRWTLDDFHGLAAVFARVDRSRVVAWKASGSVTHPATGEPAVPKLPGGAFIDSSAGGLEEFASWLTGDGGQRFARAVANRVWKDLMGRGLVEPVDDLRETNPATHPELLDFLAAEFARGGYSLRRLVRSIVTSAAFARGAGTASAPSDDRFYSRSIARPLEPEVLADAIVSVTGVPIAHTGFPAGTRAILLPDPQSGSQFLDLLGRCSRDAGCDGGRRDLGLAGRLGLLNGPLLNARVASPESILGARAFCDRPDGDLLEDLYLRSCSRPPEAQETRFWIEQLQAARARGDRRETIEDLLWSLLTSREFTTYH